MGFLSRLNLFPTSGTGGAMALGGMVNGLGPLPGMLMGGDEHKQQQQSAPQQSASQPTTQAPPPQWHGQNINFTPQGQPGAGVNYTPQGQAGAGVNYSPAPGADFTPIDPNLNWDNPPQRKQYGMFEFGKPEINAQNAMFRPHRMIGLRSPIDLMLHPTEKYNTKYGG